MVIEGISIPIGQLWSFFRWLPKYILQRKFTPETLAGLIYVDLRPRHSPVKINLGESASFELWIQIINLSPFEVELDRAEFSLWCSSILKSSILKRQKVQPGEIAIVRVHGSITDGEANQIARTISGNTVGLEGHIDFNCSLHNFSKNVGHLDGVKMEVLNAQFRTVSS